MISSSLCCIVLLNHFFLRNLFCCYHIDNCMQYQGCTSFVAEENMNSMEITVRVGGMRHRVALTCVHIIFYLCYE